MSNADEHFEEMQAHTQAKERLLRKYFDAYSQIIGHDRFTDKVTGFDLFCGPGIYDDGSEGSPMILRKAMEITINQLKSRNRIVPSFELYANDVVPEYAERLQQALNSKFPDGAVKYHVSSSDYKDKLDSVVQLSKERKRKSFIFLDPFGYKEISIEDIRLLLSSGNSEVLLWLPTSHMSRFRENKTPEALDRIQIELGISVNDFEQFRATGKQRAYINLLLKKLRTVLPKIYVDSFYIRPNPTTHHAMFFFTSHVRGAEKLLEAKWTLDQEEGNGWSYKHQLEPKLFGTVFRMNDLERLIRKDGSILYEEQGVTNAELYQFSIVNGYLPKHTREVLSKMRDLVVETIPKGGKPRKGAYYLSYDFFAKDKQKLRFKLPKL